MKNNKVFIIGIDGGTWDVLKPLMDDGTMPNLSKLVNSGVSGTLESTIPPVTAPAWTTFQTGVNPGKHGIFDFNNFNKDDYKTYFVNSKSIPLKTIWQIVSENKRKVIVVNVPVTYPPYPINGCMVTGMLTPSIKSNFTYPKELSKELLDKFPDYKIFTHQRVFSFQGIKNFLKALIRTEVNRTKVTKYLLENYDWDLAMMHFQGTDILQHALYWYLDFNNPYFNERKYNKIKIFYKVIDECIGELLDMIPENSIRIILSDHGFTSVYKIININAFLSDHGLLKMANKDFKKRVILDILTYLRKFDVFNINRFILGKGKRQKIIDKVNREVIIDWESSKAYSINGTNYSMIYLNTKGKKNSSTEYKVFCDKIVDKLFNIKDYKTKKCPIEHAYVKSDIYKGKYRKDAPDLIIKPKKGYMFSPTVIQKKYFQECKPRTNPIVGRHSLYGVFAVSGEGIKSNQSFNSIGCSIADIFPTLLYLFDIEIPSYTDGRVLKDVFKTNYLKSKKPKYVKLEEEESFRKKVSYDKGDEKIIKKRLKKLGYL